MSNSGRMQRNKAFTVLFTSTHNTPLTETKSGSVNKVAKQILFGFNANSSEAVSFCE
jgi:hypothetical protein